MELLVKCSLDIGTIDTDVYNNAGKLTGERERERERQRERSVRERESESEREVCERDK